MTPAIVSIVEGQAEVASVPVLLRRILSHFGAHDVGVTRPFRVKRYQVVREGQLERAVQLACRDRAGAACVLVLLDVEDDCPAELGPALRERCQTATSLPVSVVLASREFEAWFLGAKESLRGIRGVREEAEAPPDPESIRGAKERLSGNMERGHRYLEVDDQPALAAEMDIGQARERPKTNRPEGGPDFLVSAPGPPTNGGGDSTVSAHRFPSRSLGTRGKPRGGRCPSFGDQQLGVAVR